MAKKKNKLPKMCRKQSCLTCGARDTVYCPIEYEFTPANKIAIGLITLGMCIIAVIVYFVRG